MRQSLAPGALKAHELQLTPKCIAHNLSAETACFCTGSFQILLQSLLETNRERMIVQANDYSTCGGQGFSGSPWSG